MSPNTKRNPRAKPQAQQALSVDTRRLIRVGARPSFLDYLVQLWDYRGFIFYDAKAKVQSSNRRDRLGSIWLILNPIFLGATYYIIFGIVLNTSRGIENFIGYLVIGVFLFQFSARSITSGAQSIQGNRTVIQAFNFPRATLPIAVNIREIIASIPMLLVMVAVIVLVPPEEEISLLWLLVFPALLLQCIFNLGMSFVLARLVSKVNDFTHLIRFGMRVWLYASAVFFSYERYIEHPQILAVVQINPLFNVLDIVRDCLLYDTLPEWQSWAILAVWALAALLLGIAFFWKGEESYGRER